MSCRQIYHEVEHDTMSRINDYLTSARFTHLDSSFRRDQHALQRLGAL
ncbi:hypothetical protein SNOG_02998 [Parastagonospora nodorum SN15]|uniref:Uncharacterized protein n=1 Tax=Phaeosphaeria nodorum (strain SN15 / ATCC MYA-4574 / FGSC 10173) TaxID=321614 RepID=Q0UZ16_PHANO|nr:hypothetical protein SNOG_02998 [Parastagonospora nodorum SN15]EAT89729.1 hypothetical protein SNOG_02998 [Parastagonospora nodorum SN15]